MWSFYEVADAKFAPFSTWSLCFCAKTPPQSGLQQTQWISVIDHQPAAQHALTNTHSSSKQQLGINLSPSIEVPQIYSWERVRVWRAATSTRLSWMEVTTRVRAGITSHWCFTANRRWPRTTWRSGSASTFFICPVRHLSAATPVWKLALNHKLENIWCFNVLVPWKGDLNQEDTRSFFRLVVLLLRQETVTFSWFRH